MMALKCTGRTRRFNGAEEEKFALAGRAKDVAPDGRREYDAVDKGEQESPKGDRENEEPRAKSVDTARIFVVKGGGPKFSNLDSI